MELVNFKPHYYKAMTNVIDIWERKVRVWSICIRQKIENVKKDEKGEKERRGKRALTLKVLLEIRIMNEVHEKMGFI